MACNLTAVPSRIAKTVGIATEQNRNETASKFIILTQFLWKS